MIAAKSEVRMRSTAAPFKRLTALSDGETMAMEMKW